jgi:hypothetical protein
LRLDLNNVDETRNRIPGQIQASSSDHPDTEVEPRSRHCALLAGPVGRDFADVTRMVDLEVDERLPLQIQTGGAGRATGATEDTGLRALKLFEIEQNGCWRTDTDGAPWWQRLRLKIGHDGHLSGVTLCGCLQDMRGDRSGHA